MMKEKNLFDEDVEQISKGLDNLGTPLNAIDTQNRIWLRIIVEEIKSQDVKRKFMMKHQNQVQQAQLDEGYSSPDNQQDGQYLQDEEDIQEIFLDQDDTLQDYYMRQKGATKMEKLQDIWSGFIYYPKYLITSGSKMVDGMNTRLIEEQMRQQAQKIRPPRYTSFTMQLEPYSQKKAFALEILNEINLNVHQTESIQKLITVDKYVLIFTAKRIICVEEKSLQNFNFGNRESGSRRDKKKQLLREVMGE